MTTAHAPGARRALARDADAPPEESAAGDGWRARAQRVLVAGFARAIAACAPARRVLLAAATAALDAGIALLQRLRTCAGGTEPADQDCDPDRTGKRATTQRPGREPAAEETATPKPRRKLRGLLVYLGMMFASAMVGVSFAYDMLAHSLDQRSAEIRRQEAALWKYADAVAELKKKLDQQQAKQVETETRLAAVLAENERKLGELQAGRREADTQLARAADGSAARNHQGASAGAGNCTLVGGNVRSVLNGCLAAMNRR